MSYLLVYVGALCAFALSAISGGGAGLLLIPLLGIVVPAMQVPAALSIGTATSAVSRAAVFRRSIRWDVARWFVPAALPTTALGAWLLSRADPALVEFMLGAFLAANVVFLFRKQKPVVAAAPRPATMIAVGAAAGFLSGFTGAVGVVFNRVYLQCGLTKQEVVATRGANECLLHLVKIALYAGFGLLNRQSLAVGVLVATAAVMATWSVRPILAKVSEALFRRINYAAMAAAGVAMLVSSGATLAARYQLNLTGHYHAGQLEARLNYDTRAIAVEWRPGKLPQLERSLDVASVPYDVREEADDMREEGYSGPARFDEVRSLEGLSYEIHVGGVSRRMVVTD